MSSTWQPVPDGGFSTRFLPFPVAVLSVRLEGQSTEIPVSLFDKTVLPISVLPPGALIPTRLATLLLPLTVEP